MAPGDGAAPGPAARPRRCPGLGPWTRPSRQAPPPRRLRLVATGDGRGRRRQWRPARRGLRPAEVPPANACWQGRPLPSSLLPLPRPTPAAAKRPPHACAARQPAQALRWPPISGPVKTPPARGAAAAAGGGGAHAARRGGSGGAHAGRGWTGRARGRGRC